MKNIIFSGNNTFTYNLCGKFEAPSNEWMHLTRNLTDFELIAVTDGTLYIADDKTEYVIHKSEYLLMSPTAFQHGYRQGACSFYWVHFYKEDGFDSVDDEFFSRDDFTFNEKNIYVPITGKLSSMDRVIILMKQLQDCDKRYHNKNLNNSITGAIISEICCQSNIYKKYSHGIQTTQIFNDIADYVQYHSSENISVSQVADYFGYNPKYLSSFFKNQSGMTLKQFMLQTKMDTAKAELSDTNHSISQIAYNVGFNDAHNFTNAFKKITGLSPSEYRESYGKRALFYS